MMPCIEVVFCLVVICVCICAAVTLINKGIEFNGCRVYLVLSLIGVLVSNLFGIGLSCGSLLNIISVVA
jgi:hypothetical protein